MNINKDWTLFLDRDGVINVEKKDDYIYSWKEFRFYPDVLPVMKKFSQWFGRIIIITNQKGIGKGLMTKETLHDIHANMMEAISIGGGRIDAVYYCGQMDNLHPMRKPQDGMGLAAKKDFPDIDFNKSMMVGNNFSDMEFGKTLGVKTVFLATTQAAPNLPHPLADYAFHSLAEFANAICYNKIDRQ